jgi:cytochrome c2
MCLQTLDANDMAIETQLTWVWARPGETRTCIGCHEDRETALANTDCIAMRKKAYFTAAPKEKRRTVDFRRDIMPIIEKRCSSCHHGGKDTDGGLDLRKGFELVFHRTGCRGGKLNAAMFNHAYESLLQAPTGRTRVGTLVISGAAKYSPLIWRLYGKQLTFTDERNPYKKKSALMPPKKPLSDAEKKLFVEWVDLGAQWDNIPGEDKLPGYDADQSRAMGIAVAKRVAKPIATGKQAFEVRCLECHDASKMAKWRAGGYAKPQDVVKRMDAKRKGWIHKSEVPLILGHIRKVLSAKK